MLIMYSTVHANKYLSQTVNCSENLPAHECNNSSEVSIPFYLFCFCLQRMHRSTEDERFLENEQCQMWLERWETQAMNTPNVTLKEKRKMFLSDKTKFDVYSMITGFKVYCRMLFKMYPGSTVLACYTNQDKLENFFGEQRAVNGQTTNPSILQTGNCINAFTVKYMLAVQ